MPARQALLIGAMVALVAHPGVGLPIAEPSVELSVTPTQDPWRYRLDAQINDPDGQLSNTAICVDGIDASTCYEHLGAPSGDPAAMLTTCLTGSSDELSVEHALSEFGIFRAVARATGDGCPVVGTNATVEAVVPIHQAPPAEPIECADAGPLDATDVGVTADTIYLGATVPRSGHLAGVMGAAEKGILAAVADVNGTGGVCGRLLDVAILDDASESTQGVQLIEDLIQQGRFALVGGSAPAVLEAAIQAGMIDSQGIPVIGASGQTAAEFVDDWVWPVGPSNAAFARIAASHAYESGARRFGLAYMGWFGDEVREALQETLPSLPGATLEGEVRLSWSEADANPSVQHLEIQCRPGCDAVILALDPVMAIKWFIASRQQKAGRGSIETSLSPHAFIKSVADLCGPYCEDVLVWSGIEAPIAPAGAQAARFAESLRAIDPNADITNPFTEAAYVGTLLAARAMGRVGLELTREALRDVLNTQAFDLGLTPVPLAWVTDREANDTMRGLAMVFQGDRFLEWSDRTGWVGACQTCS